MSSTVLFYDDEKFKALTLASLQTMLVKVCRTTPAPRCSDQHGAGGCPLTHAYYKQVLAEMGREVDNVFESAEKRSGAKRTKCQSGTGKRAKSNR